jgi:nicotinate-nucleotide pyrophosphorylase (carboxylating)
MPDVPLTIPADLEDCVARALEEDIGPGDLTADLISADRHSLATVVCREKAVLAGAPWFNKVYALLDQAVQIEWLQSEGSVVEPGTRVCTLNGPSRSLVTGERTALNFLQTLSGTATITRRYVDALTDTATRLLDTRKTVPGLRSAQKYAVRCGGGGNHRMGLYDAVLIKENHILAAGSIAAAISAVRARHPTVKLEVEVENLDELTQALDAGCSLILLDNFSPDMIREARALAESRAQLEVSGGIEVDEFQRYAATGVDFISIGALTKHIRAIDFSMRVDAEA